MPEISVILPTYNSEKYITESIESVLNQKFTDFEVIVINDGSVDDTKREIAPYMDKIIYIENKTNSGVSAARNIGILACRGNLIAFQDADDVWFPDKLGKQAKFMEENKDISMVYTDCAQFDEREIRKDSFFKYHEPISGQIFERLIDENPITCSSVIVRKEVFVKCGLFDTSLRNIEDYDMWLKIANSHKIAYIDEILVKKRCHRANLSGDMGLTVINGVKVFEKAMMFFKNADAKTRKKIRKQLGLHYWDLAWYFFSKENMENSRKNLILSLKYKTNIKSLYYYIASYFPRVFLKYLKQLKMASSKTYFYRNKVEI